MPCVQVYHKYVYRRYEFLEAGRTYHFQTVNLRDVYIFQSAAADPVMYIVDGSNNIVAWNDDYTGLASEIVYTPSVTGSYTLIIRAYSTKTPGYCDLYRGVDGAQATLVEAGLLFFGLRVDAQWNQGDVFETSNSTGDPYLYLITGNKLYWNDDDGAGLNSRLVAPTAGGGTVILGSYSRTQEGGCDLCLTPAQGPVSLSPWMSPSPRRSDEWKYASPSDEMKHFASEMKAKKASMEQLEPAQREAEVIEVQRRRLSEEGRRLQVTPMPQATPEFVRCQQNFMERYREMEPELESLPYDDRAERLSELKRRTVGTAIGEEGSAQQPTDVSG